MGIDCLIYLPGNVRAKDVADVIAVAFGAKPYKYVHSSSYGRDSWWTEVDGVRVEGYTSSAGLADIMIGKSNDAIICSYLYHFECGKGTDRLIMPRSTPESIAMGRRLIKFFGGKVISNDCSDKPKTWRAKHKSDSENQPDDGKPWERFQARKLALTPLTNSEIDECAKFASYGRWTDKDVIESIQPVKP